MSTSTEPEPAPRSRWTRRIVAVVCLFGLLFIIRIVYPAYLQHKQIHALRLKGHNVSTQPILGSSWPWWIQRRLHQTLIWGAVGVSDSSPRIQDADLPAIRDLFVTTGMTFLPSPSSLTLMDSVVTDQGLAHLKGSYNLGYLTIDSQHVTDAGLVYISDLANLTRLELANTRITNTGLETLLKLPRLRTLVLNGYQFNASSVPMLKRFTKLEQLDLSHTIMPHAALAELKSALPRTKIIGL